MSRYHFQSDENKQNHFNNLLDNQNEGNIDKNVEITRKIESKECNKYMIIQQSPEIHKRYKTMINCWLKQEREMLQSQNNQNSKIAKGAQFINRFRKRSQSQKRIPEIQVDFSNVLVDEKDGQGVKNRRRRNNSVVVEKRQKINIIGSIPYMPYNLHTLVQKIVNHTKRYH